MKNYWEERFLTEGKIWGDSPSKTVLYARDLFKNHQVRNILVPGAGYGRNAGYLEAEGFEVTGIEISETALITARQSNQTIIYYQGSVLEMPFANLFYDAIYCFNVLHLFRERDRRIFIEKCFNQLKVNGVVFFIVFSEQESSFGKGNCVEVNTYESKPGRPVHYFTESDLKEHFKQFEVIETGLMEDPENHGSEGPHTHLVRYIFAQKRTVFELDDNEYKWRKRCIHRT